MPRWASSWFWDGLCEDDHQNDAPPTRATVREIDNAQWSGSQLEEPNVVSPDNLDVLRGMNSETVDLIATDPPFNKGKDFHATPESLAVGAKFQDRWSWDDDVHQEWVDQIADDWPRVRAAIDAVRMTP